MCSNFCDGKIGLVAPLKKKPILKAYLHTRAVSKYNGKGGRSQHGYSKKGLKHTKSAPRRCQTGFLDTFYVCPFCVF